MNVKKYIWIFSAINVWSITTNVFFFPNITKQINKIKIKQSTGVNYSDEKIIQEYNNATYKQIFKDINNPGEDVKDRKNKITYTWTGSWGAPTWGKLTYKFSAGYAFLINKMIMEPEHFVNRIKQWIKNGDGLSDQLKIKILKDLFLNYINISNHEYTRDFFMGNIYNTDTLIRKIENYLIVSKEQHHYRLRDEQMTEILRGSLLNVIKQMETDENSSWIFRYIYEPYTKQYGNIAYDGGINFFVYYNSKNYQKFLDYLLRGRSRDFIDRIKMNRHPYSTNHEFTSERTSGGRNYLSFINWDSWLYYYPED